MFEYIPQLYERLRHAVLKYNINSINKPPTKLRYLFECKIYLTLDYEKAGDYMIRFTTEHPKSLFDN